MQEATNSQSFRPGFLKRCWYKLYGVWFWVVFTFAALLTLCLIAVMPGQERRRRIAKRGASIVFFLTGARPHVSGLHLLPDCASVVVANHASYLDGILLTAVLPHQYRFVIKREVTKVPLVNFFLQRIGAHFVERFDKHRGANDARKIMQTANNGASLAFFPEGTFLREPGLRRFHNGAFTIAIRRDMPLVPLAISGTRQMLPAQRWMPIPVRLRINIREPLLTAEISEVRVALELCRESILADLDEPDLLANEKS
ncbi:MAG: lysophospholipid acyltransferase family protein [Pseudomonadales bacterium]